VAAVDVARPLRYPGYRLGSPQALETLVQECQERGVTCLPFAANVRDDTAVAGAVER
jgi:hypothetical protein